MRFGIAIPQHVGAEGFDATAFKAHLERAEELGFESAWVQEQVLGPASALAPLGALTSAAACPARRRLGCAVRVTPLPPRPGRALHRGARADEGMLARARDHLPRALLEARARLDGAEAGATAG